MRTLFILLFSSISALAQPVLPSAFWAPGKTGASATNILVDMWEDFEFASLTAGNLGTHSHTNGSVSLTWLVTDTGTKFSMSGTGERTTINNPDNTSDSGTNGLACDCTGGIAATVRITIPAHDSVSQSIWFFAPTLTADAPAQIMHFYDAVPTSRQAFTWRRSAGAYDFRCTTNGITVAELGAGLTSGVWYWLTMKYAKSGTLSWEVFDSAGAQVGTTITSAETSGAQITRALIGNASPLNQAVTMYFDDWLIDLTSAQFPLGP